jgi:hypothetical protein
VLRNGGIVNREHIEQLSSDGWASFLASDLLPWVIGSEVDLGAAVLEVGPGPGRTTDILSNKFARLTAVEVDEQLAAQLSRRFDGSNVTVQHADAADMPFSDGFTNVDVAQRTGLFKFKATAPV